MDLPDPDTVTTLPDFISYLEDLARHFELEPDEWQHREIGAYLNGIAAWLRATPVLADAREEFQREIEQVRPTWRGVATLFEVGRIYE